MSRALVLAAHGSRRDPTARTLVQHYADLIRARHLFDEVTAAFHHGTPRFDTVLDTLESRSVTVVPVMTSAGHYANAVLPAALRRNRRFAAIRLNVMPPVGTHPRLPEVVARRVSTLLNRAAIPREATTLAVVGHGTRRHRSSRGTALALAEALAQRDVAGEVISAFIDDDPPLEELASRVTRPHLVVVPFLIGGSEHAARELPAALPREAHIDDPVGTYRELPDFILHLAGC